MTAAPQSVTTILGTHHLSAALDPGRTAVIWRDGSYTYEELRDQATKLAGSFVDRGLAEGDRVLSQLRNRGEVLVLYFACAYAGLSYVPVNFRLTDAEAQQIIEDCAPALVFSQEGLPHGGAASALPHSGDDRLIVLSEHAPGPQFEELAASCAVERPRTSEAQLILYTSGTTGRPKGVVLPHSTILGFALQQAALYRHLNDRSVTLLPGPMSNTAAINEQSIPTLLVGGTVAMMPSGGWTAERMFDCIDSWGVTHTEVFPTMMRDLLQTRSSSLESMQYVVTGGEYCPPHLMSEFEEAWPHIELVVAYGSTESGLVSYISKAERASRPASVGRAAPTHIIEIRDAQNRPCASGTVGEVWTTGPGVAWGYWNAEELTAEYFADGWVKIGDLGYLDDDGYLYLTGRSKDLIISKSQNVYPAEIEVVLNACPQVQESAVFGVADEEYGELVCAAVVPERGERIDVSELRRSVRERLAGHKVPKRFVVLDKLPRSQTGKVVKAQLQRMVGERDGRGAPFDPSPIGPPAGDPVASRQSDA